MDFAIGWQVERVVGWVGSADFRSADGWFDAKAIDTNGAGDMFAGAFLYAITSGKSYAWAADLANDCASRVVGQFGPRLKVLDFDAIKAKFRL